MPHEECGVLGMRAPVTRDLATLSYYALFALQHRGQESAGMAVVDDGVFSTHKGVGLVDDVFNARALTALGAGNMVVGHVRYSTTGTDRLANAQPLVVNHRKGRMALAHNGNITNSSELHDVLEDRGSIFHTTSDTEVIAYLIVEERLRLSSIEAAVSAVMYRLEGAYSLVLASPAKLVAARDPHGFRPLCMGRTDDGVVVFASETCALDAVSAHFVRDVMPGEVVTVDDFGVHSDTSHCGKKPKRLCVFEHIYFSRPDSVVDGQSVSLARQRAGAFLAQTFPVEADIVVGVPDSGLDAAVGYACASAIPYAIGFTKNKYVGRTFIAPDQPMRESSVRLKLNPIRSVIKGKRVVLIDDSIVRGTTIRHTVGLMRLAGAREVHLRISAPPFVAPCFYGVDIDSADKLIANQMSPDEIARHIGVDSLGYLGVEQMLSIASIAGPFCYACFGGEYPTTVPDRMEKDRFSQKIGRKV